MSTLKSDFDHILKLSNSSDFELHGDSSVSFDMKIDSSRVVSFSFVTLVYPDISTFTDSQSHQVVSGDYSLKVVLCYIAKSTGFKIWNIIELRGFHTRIYMFLDKCGIDFSTYIKPFVGDINNNLEVGKDRTDETIPESNCGLSEAFIGDKNNFNETFGQNSLSCCLPGLSDFKLIQMKLEFGIVKLDDEKSKLFGFGPDDLIIIDFTAIPAVQYRNTWLDHCNILLFIRVVDLLLLLASAAVNSQARASIIFDPYPTVIDPSNSNYNLVIQALNKIPSMSNLVKLAQDNETLPDAFIVEEHVDPIVFPLLEWVIASNRTLLQKLSPDQCILSMNTNHQFLVERNSPEKEAKFEAAKRQFGKSIFIFHGSPIENWHSIIRKGLIKASGTKYQINGGNGIYMCLQSATSAHYTAVSNFTPKTGIQITQTDVDTYLKNSSSAISVIAFCEVVESPSLSAGNPVRVEQNADHVSIRFLFVYKAGQHTVPTNIDLNADSNIQVLRDSIKKCQEQSIFNQILTFYWF